MFNFKTLERYIDAVLHNYQIYFTLFLIIKTGVSKQNNSDQINKQRSNKTDIMLIIPTIGYYT